MPIFVILKWTPKPAVVQLCLIRVETKTKLQKQGQMQMQGTPVVKYLKIMFA